MYLKLWHIFLKFCDTILSQVKCIAICAKRQYNRKIQTHGKGIVPFILMGYISFQAR